MADPAGVVHWKSLSLTHVYYPEGDFVGYILAWFSLLPIFIVVAFIALILFRRDLHTVCFFGGILLDELLNMLLKRIFRESRPSAHSETLLTFGMPSSHSQFAGFFLSYILMFLCVRTHRNSSLLEEAWKVALGTLCLASACLVCISRVYLSYHDTRQVAVGAAVGLTAGLLWFGVVQLILTPLFPIIVSWPLCEYFMIRDYTLIPNVLWFEYTSCRTEARARQRKVGRRTQ